MINAEAIVSAYLRGLPAVKGMQALVMGETPPSTAKPWVRVTLIDPQNATGTNRVEHLMAYYLQLDCYAGEKGGQPEAFALADAVRSALVAMPDTQPLAGAVVTDVDPLSMPRTPDPDLAGRQRYILDIEIFAHPSA